MKARHLIVGLFALLIFAGSVTPAHAATHKHKHHRHAHHQKS
jgi:hypothetical protein